MAATLATVVAALLGASACDTSPGAAAVVGGQRISIHALQEQVSDALNNPQANAQFGKNRTAFAREVLAQQIFEKLVAKTASAHHVTASPQDIAAQQASFVQQAGSLTALKQQAAQGGVPESALNDVIRTDALQNRLGDALIANLPVSQTQLQSQYAKDSGQFNQAHAAHILVASKSLAHSILAQVRRDPSKFAALAAKYSTDTGSKANGGDLGFVGKGQTVPPFDKAIFNDPIGSYVLVHSQFGYHVIHVIARKHETLEQATPQLKDEILATQRDNLVQQAISNEAKHLGVHVSPRYGKWDAAEQIVAGLTFNKKTSFVTQ